MLQHGLEFGELSQRVRSARERARIFTRLTLGLSLIGFVLLSYSGWFIVFALLTLLCALGCGIAALVFMAGARSTPVSFAVMGFLVFACLLMSFNAVVQLIFIEQVNTYADCMNHALTLSRQQQCAKQLEEGFLGSVMP